MVTEDGFPPASGIDRTRSQVRNICIAAVILPLYERSTQYEHAVGRYWLE